MKFFDAQQVFEIAIALGHLNVNPQDEMYAGNWMYMHSEGNVHEFKNIISRNYVEFKFEVKS